MYKKHLQDLSSAGVCLYNIQLQLLGFQIVKHYSEGIHLFSLIKASISMLLTTSGSENDIGSDYSIVFRYSTSKSFSFFIEFLSLFMTSRKLLFISSSFGTSLSPEIRNIPCVPPVI